MKYNKKEHIKVEREEVRGNRRVKIGKYFCLLNNKTYDTLGGLRNAIKPNMTMREYYDTFYKTDEECNSCMVCNKNARVFLNFLKGYSKVCSSACFNRTEDKRKRISERFIGNEVKKLNSDKKRKDSMLLKSDVELEQINDKRMNTLKERYGVYYMSERTKKQWKNRTKEDIERLVAKSNKTKLLNGSSVYNFYNASNKSIEILGKTFHCQGYEPYILKYLLEDLKFCLDDVMNGKDVPRIKHKCLSGVYVPDIYVKSLNLLIEVKSDYTFLKESENKFIKQKSSLEQKYNHVYFVPTPKNNSLTETDKKLFKKFIDMTISSEAQLIENVQRLSCDGEYTPIAIGSGSARALGKKSVI